MYTRWVGVAALLALTAVIGGALGSHALKDRLTPDQLVSYEVGIRYQMYHALAILAAAGLMSIRASRAVSVAAWCWLAGVVLFSGSIYALVLLGWKWLGPVTPFGGLFLMVGWLLLAVAALSPVPPGATTQKPGATQEPCETGNP